MDKTISQRLNLTGFDTIEIKDRFGNTTYYEDSKGYWYKRECDEQGNQISFINNRGDWSRCEYDKQGEQVYVTNSNGYLIDNRIKINLNK